ncbi:MAG: ATP synthase F1 subunit gamma [Lachnospiraceae bacterium]|jgi:F-type H+-transporting ATPase subunit gamma|nr:ATP synthase F1 subunit gamma [uncultured Acetatifactor sp.]MCI9221036.1 ATP synthase F1 subunit gamma [Lachnospiraceae bacterium]
MASMRDIKRRKTSIQGTQQITKAMKLVSTVKLQRARASAERSKGYFTCMYDTVNNILQRVGHIDHPYLIPGESRRKAVVVITSNRGLAGGYNSNVTKLVTRHPEWKKEDLDLYCLGNKGRETFARNGYTVKECDNDIVESPMYADAAALSEKLLASYAAGEIGEIYLAYTGFKNTVSHVPTLLRLLPVDVEEQGEKETSNEAAPIMNFETEDTEALDLLIPKYVTSLIYGALRESVASENGARMQAMDNATSNAEEIISDLTLKYNRARQGSITQELTEIIAGAEALG